MLLGILGAGLFLFLMNHWYQDHEAKTLAKKTRISAEKEAILQKPEPLLPKSEKKIHEAIVVKDDLKFPVDSARIHENGALMPGVPIETSTLNQVALTVLEEKENIFSLDPYVADMPPKIDAKILEVQLDEKLNLSPLQMKMFDLRAPAKKMTRSQPVDNKGPGISFYSALRIDDEALASSAYMQTSLSSDQQTLPTYNQMVNLFKTAAGTEGLFINIKHPLSPMDFQSLSDEFGERPLRRIPLKNTDIETVTANANFAAFRQGLTLFSFEGWKALARERPNPYENAQLLELLSLFALGLIVWSALLYFLPHTSSVPLSKSIFARRSSAESWMKLSEWQLAGRIRAGLEGIPMLRMSFHEVSGKKAKAGRRNKTTIWVHPEKIIQESKSRSSA